MFDIGFWELLFIGVIALLVVGPERLPGLAVRAGQWVGRLRRFVNRMRSEIQEELEAEHLKELLAEQNREIDELKREVGEAREDAERAVREASREAEGSGATPDTRADGDGAEDEAAPADRGADADAGGSRGRGGR